MHVSPSHLDGIIRTYLKNTERAKSTKKPGKGHTDAVSLSKDVKEFGNAIKSIMESDDVRANKVKELKNRINKGTYDIDGKLVAEKIVEEYFGDKLI